MGFRFNRISDFFVLVVVVQEVLHERGFSNLGASRAKNIEGKCRLKHPDQENLKKIHFTKLTIGMDIFSR